MHLLQEFEEDGIFDDTLRGEAIIPRGLDWFYILQFTLHSIDSFTAHGYERGSSVGVGRCMMAVLSALSAPILFSSFGHAYRCYLYYNCKLIICEDCIRTNHLVTLRFDRLITKTYHIPWPRLILPQFSLMGRGIGFFQSLGTLLESRNWARNLDSAGLGYDACNEPLLSRVR